MQLIAINRLTALIMTEFIFWVNCSLNKKRNKQFLSVLATWWCRTCTQISQKSRASLQKTGSSSWSIRCCAD